MPHRIAERLRDISIRCARLADECTDKKISNELEGISVELAQKSRKLDDLFQLIETVA